MSITDGTEDGVIGWRVAPGFRVYSKDSYVGTVEAVRCDRAGEPEIVGVRSGLFVRRMAADSNERTVSTPHQDAPDLQACDRSALATPPARRRSLLSTDIARRRTSTPRPLPILPRERIDKGTADDREVVEEAACTEKPITHPFVRQVAYLLCAWRISKEISDGRAERRQIPWVVEKDAALAVDDLLSDTTYAGGDDRSALPHRLGDSQAEALSNALLHDDARMPLERVDHHRVLVEIVHREGREVMRRRASAGKSERAAIVS